VYPSITFPQLGRCEHYQNNSHHLPTTPMLRLDK
jgi:hypothetical protein